MSYNYEKEKDKDKKHADEKHADEEDPKKKESKPPTDESEKQSGTDQVDDTATGDLIAKKNKARSAKPI